jgi:hypothetical protein
MPIIIVYIPKSAYRDPTKEEAGDALFTEKCSGHKLETIKSLVSSGLSRKKILGIDLRITSYKEEAGLKSKNFGMIVTEAAKASNISVSFPSIMPVILLRG